MNHVSEIYIHTNISFSEFPMIHNSIANELAPHDVTHVLTVDGYLPVLHVYDIISADEVEGPGIGSITLSGGSEDKLGLCSTSLSTATLTKNQKMPE